MKLQVSFIVLAYCSLIAYAILENYPIFNGDGENNYWIANLSYLPVPNNFITRQANGTAPEHCIRTAVDQSFCNPYDIEVYNIYYADCHAPWVVCRCIDTPPSFNIGEIAKFMGLPVRARSWVRHFSFYNYQPTVPPLAAYSTSNDINVLGDWHDSNLLHHETAHNLDWWVAGGAGTIYSDTSEWQNQVAQDSCIPSSYSRASWQEDFAETALHATYEENFGPSPRSTACMSHALTTARNILRGAIKIVPGDLCVDRIAPSTNICMGPISRAAGLCNGVLDTTHTNGAMAKVAQAVFPVFTRLAKDQREFDEGVAKAWAEMIAKGPEKPFPTSRPT